MKYTISFNNTPFFVELTWSGEVYIDQLIEAFIKIVSDERYIAGLSFLIDYRNATPMLRYHDLDALANLANKAPAGYRSAAVMKDEIDISLAEIWREYSARVPHEEFECFNSYQNAIDWLKENKKSS